MAEITFLDSLGILDFFAPLFAALLIFAVVYAILNRTQILGESKAIQWVVAIALGLLTLIYPDIISLVNFISPWFVLLFIFLILVLVSYQIFGYTQGDIVEYVRGDRTVNWVLVSLAIIIIVAGVFSVFGERALQGSSDASELSEGEADFQGNVFQTVFSRQILGVLLIFVIAVFAIAFLGGAPPID
jgi:hypothetical protein